MGILDGPNNKLDDEIFRDLGRHIARINPESLTKKYYSVHPVINRHDRRKLKKVLKKTMKIRKR